MNMNIVQANVFNRKQSCLILRSFTSVKTITTRYFDHFFFMACSNSELIHPPSIPKTACEIFMKLTENRILVKGSVLAKTLEFPWMVFTFSETITRYHLRTSLKCLFLLWIHRLLWVIFITEAIHMWCHLTVVAQSYRILIF